MDREANTHKKKITCQYYIHENNNICPILRGIICIYVTS